MRVPSGLVLHLFLFVIRILAVTTDESSQQFRPGVLEWLWPDDSAPAPLELPTFPSSKMWLDSRQLVPACTLQGKVGSDAVLMRIWMRLVLVEQQDLHTLSTDIRDADQARRQSRTHQTSADEASSAHLGSGRWLIGRGFAFPESALDYNAGKPYTQLSLNDNAGSPYNLTIRSPSSGRNHQVVVQRMRHSTAPLALEVMPVQLTAAEVAWGEVQLRATGFPFYCTLALEAAQEVGSGAGGAPHRMHRSAQRRLRYQPHLTHNTDTANTEASTQYQETEQQQQRRLLRRTSQPAPDPDPNPDPDSPSGTDDATPAPHPSHTLWLQPEQPEATAPIFLLTPFHNMNATDAVALMLAHMAWHSRLGVAAYLWYLTEQVAAVAGIPIVKELVRQGRLTLVHWQDMPMHERTPYVWSYFDHYAAQALQYNQAMLAFWGQDVRLLVADVDEYLVTPTPGMRVLDAWRECKPAKGSRPPDRRMAGMQVRRVNGLCTGKACPPKHQGAPPEISLWLHILGRKLGLKTGTGLFPAPPTSKTRANSLNTSPPAVSQADPATLSDKHPLHLYSVSTAINLKAQSDQKAIVDPAGVASYMVHTFYPWPRSGCGGACVWEVLEASDVCVRWIHLPNLHLMRQTDNGSTAPSTAPAARDGVGGGREAGGRDGTAHAQWLWPLQHL